MSGILVYAEVRDGIVQPITFELIAAARSLSLGGLGEVVCFVPVADAAGIAQQLAGSDRILTLTHKSLSPYNPEAHQIALEAAVAEMNPSLVLVGYNSIGTDLGGYVALRRGLAMVAYCIKLEAKDGALEAESQLYGGKLLAHTEVPLPALAAVVPGSFDDAAGRTGGSAAVTELAAPTALDGLRVEVNSVTMPDAGQIDLTKADQILCVGRGIGGPEKIKLAEDLAAAMQVELAGSRPVIDSGWLPKARQVGKSGQKVKPKLYIAVGVSGAPEHLEGMKSSDCIVAINTDPKAPIFGHAHYGTTCDLFELLPALAKRIGQA